MNGMRAALTWASRPSEWSSVFSEMYDMACNVNKWPEGGSGSLLCVSVSSFIKQNHKGTWPTDFCEDFTSEQSSEPTSSKNSAGVLSSLFSSFYWQIPLGVLQDASEVRGHRSHGSPFLWRNSPCSKAEVQREVVTCVWLLSQNCLFGSMLLHPASAWPSSDMAAAIHRSSLTMQSNIAQVFVGEKNPGTPSFPWWMKK